LNPRSPLLLTIDRVNVFIEDEMASEQELDSSDKRGGYACLMRP